VDHISEQFQLAEFPIPTFTIDAVCRDAPDLRGFDLVHIAAALSRVALDLLRRARGDGASVDLVGLGEVPLAAMGALV
jgi:hypothetical protein